MLRIVLPIAIAVTLLPALPAFAQSGLRVGSGASILQQRAEQLARIEHPAEVNEVRLALTPLGGQGFSFSPEGWAAVGFRLPPGFDTAAPNRAGLAAGTGAALDYRIHRWTLSSSVRQGLTAAQTDASRLDFGASYGVPLATRHELVMSGGLGFGAGGGLAPTAGEEFTAARALQPYAPGAGLRDMGLRLSWRYSLDRNLFVNTSVGVDRMFTDPMGTGSAYERNVGSVGAVFGYRFY